MLSVSQMVCFDVICGQQAAARLVEERACGGEVDLVGIDVEWRPCFDRSERGRDSGSVRLLSV
jgi:hypothetical protein